MEGSILTESKYGPIKIKGGTRPIQVFEKDNRWLSTIMSQTEWVCSQNYIKSVFNVMWREWILPEILRMHLENLLITGMTIRGIRLMSSMGTCLPMEFMIAAFFSLESFFTIAVEKAIYITSRLVMKKRLRNGWWDRGIHLD